MRGRRLDLSLSIVAKLICWLFRSSKNCRLKRVGRSKEGLIGRLSSKRRSSRSIGWKFSAPTDSFYLDRLALLFELLQLSSTLWFIRTD